MAVQEKHVKIWRFGVFEVDGAAPGLRRSGVSIKIREQPFRVLVYLLEHKGELVSREDLRRVLWPADTFVDFDHSLNTAMMNLRDVLGDVADAPIYIETVPKRGYRFIAAVNEIQPNGVVPGLPGEGASTPAEEEASVSDARSARVRPTYLTIPALLLLVVGASVTLLRVWDSRAASTYPAFDKEPRPVVTVPGLVQDPALSPDGKEVAFSLSNETLSSADLYVQLIGADQPLRLTHNLRGFVCCAAWSPDGQQIAYGRCDENGGAVFVVPALGGTERKITDVVCPFNTAGTPQWTSDGKSLLLADQCTPKSVRGIVLFSLLTGERRCLTSPSAGGDLGDFGPIPSLDQKTLAFIRSTTLDRNDVYTVDLSGKNLRRLTHNGSVSCGPIMWTVGGEYVVFRGSLAGRPSRVPVEGGPIEPASTFPAVGSLSRDGRRLAYVDGDQLFSVSHAELASTGGKVLSVKNLSTSSVGGEDSPQLASDGKHLIVRSWRAGGHAEIWKTDLDGQSPVQLTRTTDPGWVGSPHWSPDGKWIVMDFRPGDHSEIWMIDSEGRNFHPVIADSYENFVPRWSRDSRSVYFTSNRSGEWQIWRLDLTSGQKTRITDQGGISAFESYDGSTLYYAKRESGGLFRRSLAGGPEVLVTDALHVEYWGAFAVLENGLYFLDTEASPRPAIYYYDFRTRRSNLVLSLDRMPLPGNPTLSASRDGRTILFTQLEAGTHINLAEAEP